MQAIIKRITALDNLRSAVRSVKIKHPLLRDRKWFDNNLDKKLKELSAEMDSGFFMPEKVILYYSMLEKKLRCAQLDARSWVAHEAIISILSDIIDDISVDNCTVRVADGENILVACKQWKKNNAWVAGSDIRRFFDSVGHRILMATLSDLIPCDMTLHLIKNFFDAFDESSLAFSKEESTHIHSSEKGLPAGLELVYILVHGLLQPIDAEMEKITGGRYARYIDDFILFSNDFEEIEKWLERLKIKLDLLGFQLKPEKTFVQPTSEAFMFLRQRV